MIPVTPPLIFTEAGVSRAMARDAGGQRYGVAVALSIVDTHNRFVFPLQTPRPR